MQLNCFIIHNGLKRRSCGGFTLIEMTLVILIAGVMAIPFYSYLNMVMKAKPEEDRIAIIKHGLAEYQRIFGYLPCPSRLAAAPGDVDYSAASCATALQLPGAGATPTDTVYYGSVPVDDLATAMDCKNDAHATMPDGTAMPDNLAQVFKRNLYKIASVVSSTAPVSISAQCGSSNGQAFSAQPSDNLCVAGDTASVVTAATPAGWKWTCLNTGTGVTAQCSANTDASGNHALDRTRCPAKADMLDKYGDKIAYAVTKSATALATFDPSAGEILIRDQNNSNATVKPQLFALIGFGKDQAGATSARGIAFGTGCTFGPGGATAMEVLNCQYASGQPAIFRNMPVSTAPNANYFDDEVSFSLSGSYSEEDYWTWKQGAGTSLNMTLNNNSRLIVSAGVAPGVSYVSTDDKMVVNGGNVHVQGAGAQGNLNADAKVEAKKDVQAGTLVHVTGIHGNGTALSPKYCYNPPMTATCN